MEEIENSGLGPYYIDHTVGIWPQSAGGVPFNACEFQSKGDPITDLFEDLAAEQKARSTYDYILRVVKNIPEVADPSLFTGGFARSIKARVKGIEIFGIQLLLHGSQCFTETLEMDYLSCPKETDGSEKKSV